MMHKNKLLEQLIDLRTELRLTHFNKTGEQIIILSDAALFEVAQKRPLKQNEFNAISGLDEDFNKKYAQKFLSIIKSFNQSNLKSVKVSKQASKVLHHYKDRLTNMSKTNSNLYMGQIYQNHSFDLTLIENNLELKDYLTNNRIKNLKLNYKSDADERHITKLYREVNKTQIETGSYNLYIAYPYVEGIFSKDKFPIKAPLLYFPVKIERTLRTFTLKKDSERDVIFNRDLLLITSKMEKSSMDFITPEVTDFNEKVLHEVVIPFYEKHGISIEIDAKHIEFIPFKNELKEDFIKVNRPKFKLQPYATLSRFELYSSSIQKDMERILATKQYNDLLEGLIDETNLFKQEVAKPMEISGEPINEDNISYINDLNFSQERVIDLLNSEKKIVIWGPPGTGKSQTITSLIASSILKGENVLVVSEKKVALDVIYSRLKKASKYAMFIDDAENKQDFYYKLNHFLEPEPPVRTLNNDIYALESEIKRQLNDMEKSLQLLYGHTFEDKPVFELFSRYIKDKDIKLHLTPYDVHKIFHEVFKKPSFQMIEALEKTFDNDAHLKRMMDLDWYLEKYPILEKLETKIPRSQKLMFDQMHEKYLQLKTTYQRSGIFKKRKHKKTFIKTYLDEITYLSVKKSIRKKYLNQLFIDDRLHSYIFENMNRLNKLMTIYQTLKPFEKTFLKMMHSHPKVRGIDDNYKLRTYIFEAYYSGFIEVFKSEHQKHLYIFDNYQEKVDKIKEIMHQKMLVTNESFEMELYKHALNLNNTKRIMDIKRVFDLSNKPSIKSFIENFQLEMKSHIRLWMMTPEVVSAILPLEHGMFDLVIFDEASQMYVEKGIPAIYRAKKVVIAGDPKQLRPSSLGTGRTDELDEFYEDDVFKEVSLDAKSLLDLARYRFKEALLNYHYRSTYEELIAFSNHAFYDAKLMISPNQKKAVEPPIEYVYVKDGMFENRRNKKEATKVVEVIKKILRTRQHNESIGVITFNSTQRDAIENAIDQELFKKGTYQKAFEQELFRKDDGEDKSLFVKNIENVQGDERDIIIFSMGYAKNSQGQVMRRFGWLNHDGGQNRLNVAITRAKQKIYFISSLYPEEFKVEDLSSTGPKLLKDFMRYCYYVSNENENLAKEVLNHLHSTEIETRNVLIAHMAEDVKKRLERLGYEVDLNVGIGKYKINLAIKDDKQKAYILGILTDVGLSDLNARRDLLHQEKYLESRGWTVYRLLESNWYTDPNKELKQIKDLIKIEKSS